MNTSPRPAGEPPGRAARLIAQPLLDRLAFYSGGRARDFVKMIHMIAQDAWQADADAATDDIVESVATRSTAC